LHLRAEFAEEYLFVWASRRRLLVFDDWHGIVKRIRNAVTLGAPVMIDKKVASHASHPSSKAAVRRSVTAKRPINPEKNILRQVLGFRAIADEPVTDVKDAARMATHKLLPGRANSLEALLDQLGILLQRKISLESTRTSLGPTPVAIFAGLGKQRQTRCLEPFERVIRPATVWNVNCSRIVPLAEMSTDEPFLKDGRNAVIAGHLTRP